MPWTSNTHCWDGVWCRCEWAHSYNSHTTRAKKKASSETRTTLLIESHRNINVHIKVCSDIRSVDSFDLAAWCRSIFGQVKWCIILCVLLLTSATVCLTFGGCKSPCLLSIVLHFSLVRSPYHSLSLFLSLFVLSASCPSSHPKLNREVFARVFHVVLVFPSVFFFTTDSAASVVAVARGCSFYFRYCYVFAHILQLNDISPTVWPTDIAD